MYAATTSVPAERSQQEIQKLLQKFGATQFISGWDADRALIGFTLSTNSGPRMIKFILPLPKPNQQPIQRSRRPRSAASAQAAYDQEVRRRWRALLLVLKAKLESVESGIATLEEEFMPWIVLPDGSTVGQFMTPQIDRAYKEKTMPSLLPMLPAPSSEED